VTILPAEVDMRTYQSQYKYLGLVIQNREETEGEVDTTIGPHGSIVIEAGTLTSYN
jgi:hypothetical protein